MAFGSCTTPWEGQRRRKKEKKKQQSEDNATFRRHKGEKNVRRNHFPVFDGRVFMDGAMLIHLKLEILVFWLKG